MNRIYRSITHSWMVLLCLSLLAACGGGGGGKSTPQPTANAGAAQTVIRGSTVTLDGSASTSPRSGATLTYRWALAIKPELSTAALTGPTTAKPGFVADLPGLYEADLIVNDGTIDSAPTRVTITVTSPDPVAVAETSHEVLIGTTVTLDGSRSIAPTGSNAAALTYDWVLTSTPAAGTATLAGSGPARTLYANVAGRYTVQLTVGHGDKVSAPLEVTIMASNANTKPVANAGGPYTIERGQTLTLDGTKSTDADGSTLSYRWYVMNAANTSGLGSIYMPNGSSLRLETAIKGHDTATPTITPDVVGNWTVFLEVYDGTTLSTTASTTITVTKPAGAVNTPPVAAFFGTPRVAFYDAVYSNEVELGTTTYLAGANSWDIDGAISSANRKYQWVSTPAGYTQAALTGSFTSSVAGAYTMQLIVNDGVIDSAPTQRTQTARTGANVAPVPNVAVDSGTILVGGTGWLDARNSTDVNGDQLTYTWSLFDKPDGSAATLKYENVTLESGTVLRNARAGVVADKPGVYIVLLAVTDSHGVTSSPIYAYYGKVIAKAKNNPPSIGRISNTNDEGPYRRLNTHFNDSDQPYVVGDGAVTLYMVEPVDPDLDTLYSLWTLEQPAGSTLTDAAGTPLTANATTRQFTPGSPMVPGIYTATAIVSDGMARSAPKTLSFKVVNRADYPSLLLEDKYSATINSWDNSVSGGGTASIPAATEPRHQAFPYWHHGDSSFPIFGSRYVNGDNLIKNYRLTAYGGDYTITNLKVGTSTNTDYPGYSGKFSGLSNGQVIKKGTSVDFSLVINAPGGQSTTNTQNNLVQGIAFTFDVAEKPGWTFAYQPFSY